ncbi:hypothetical protein Ahy_B01g051665 [Arachis hypogaea]|uniref:Uncharacterized protein n=1 Tax=Arachis hypogaea TaxID=3818 RepID=A0A445AMH1_ARAHY|nr:hypothetical protein Ahy_B01g051665 [Arachis hypogaea]
MPPLIVEMKDVVFIKPSKSTPSSVLSLSTLDHRPDLNMLYHIIQVYKSQKHDGYPNDQIDPNPINVIKKSLSKALFYYYPLAGKIVKHDDGKFRIHCNSNDRVPFIEAIANCNLSSLNYLDDGSSDDMEIAKQLAFQLPSLGDENGHQYPLRFKVTKFLCGGFTIGIGISHILCDGFGLSQFLHALIELARGRNEPSIKPVWERERLMGSITEIPLPSPINNASAAVSPHLPATTLVHECFKVDGESIRRLKMRLIKEYTSHNNIKTMKEIFTNFESLTAYIWRSRARALKLNHDGKTLLGIVVGARRHLDPPLPEGYYGNAIVDANVVLSVKELMEKPLSQVVKHIKEIKKVAFTRNYITDSINTLVTKEQDFNVDGIGAYFNVTDWKHLGFLENMDFGGNVLVNSLPAPCNMFAAVDLCIFAPPSKLDSSMKDEGVRVFVSLPNAAMPKFREEMEALILLNNI